MTKKRRGLPDLGLECVSCFGARQVQAIPGLADVAAKHDHGGPAVTIFRGMALCEIHLNLTRGFPADFPDGYGDADGVAKLRARYEKADRLLADLGDE